jgi:hypothetical protein
MSKSLTELALEQGKGIVRLLPAWVPRVFSVPGRRIKLHPEDYYALGAARGGIDERWLASTIVADNGPGTPPDEGLSYIAFEEGSRVEKVLLRDAIDELGGAIIGDRLWGKYGGWPMFAKFFDNKGPLPFHIHQREEHARLVGQASKPEAYYFPVQLNNYGADFPYTFFGLRPGTTKEDLIRCLERFTSGDNRITDLSVAYKLNPGTGWDVPAGILHAPGSLCTYEPQKASDVFAMFESLVADAIIPEGLLWKDVPVEKHGDLDFLVELLDWELNTDLYFAEHHAMLPRPAKPREEMEAEGYREDWIVYKSSAFSAKELTVYAGRTVTITDNAAYGLIILQGHGKLNHWDVESPALIRFGQPTMDEYFVTEDAAKEGVTISNPSRTDPLVMLKHFGPENPDLPLQ